MKQFKITFHESQTGRKIIDVTDDIPDEPSALEHKGTDSLDFSQSTLDSSNDKNKSTPYSLSSDSEEFQQSLDSAPMSQADQDITFDEYGNMIVRG